MIILLLFNCFWIGLFNGLKYNNMIKELDFIILIKDLLGFLGIIVFKIVNFYLFYYLIIYN